MKPNPIDVPDMISLGALECSSSCIMTALSAFGLNPNYFLLGYWDINYFHDTLLSSRDPHYFDLRMVYGMQKTYYEQERLEPMLASIRAGNMIMYRCKASKLPFFPESMLVHEGTGFNHYCLLVDYEPISGRFTVIDPIAGHIGGLSTDEALAASTEAGKLIYFELDKPEARFRTPNPGKLLRHGAVTNYYTMFSNPCGGLKAFELFAGQLEDSLGWERTKRESWLQSNAVAVSSTIKIRKWIWESFASLNVLNEREHACFETRAKEIAAFWTRLNLSLLKLKHKGNPELTVACRSLLIRLHDLEKQFIVEMHELSNRIEEQTEIRESG